MSRSVDLTGMPVPGLLNVLKARKVSGELRVVSTYRQVVLTLVDGDVTAVQSNRPGDRLGLQLMKAGDIGIMDLHNALVEQHQQRLRAIATDTATSRLGEILVDQKVLAPEELQDALAAYLTHITRTLEHDLVLHVELTEGQDDLSEEAIDHWITANAG